MSYNHKYIPGWTYAFYNNSDELEDNANFNYWQFNIVRPDNFITVYEDAAVLTKDIIDGNDYRWYSSFTFPNIEIGCYRFLVYDAFADQVISISDPFEVVSDDEGLLYCNYRNPVSILNINYTGLPSFENKFHVELKRRKPLNIESSVGYRLVNNQFNRVRTTLGKGYEFVTGWFDEKEHDATQAMTIHKNLNVSFNGKLNAMNRDDESEYLPEWREDFDNIQVAFRMNENNTNSSNKGT